MKCTIELDRETDGRWIGAVRELPGCLVYGDDRADAVARVRSLAHEVIADAIAHGERVAEPIEFAEPTT
jgi:predicted RNase H-like HicB family nuclease